MRVERLYIKPYYIMLNWVCLSYLYLGRPKIDKERWEKYLADETS